MSLFGEGLERSGKPVEEDVNLPPVDLRTKQEEPGAGENAEAEAAAAAQALEEKETRKQEFIATGKTPEEFEAAETAAEAEKNKTPEELAAAKLLADDATAKQEAELLATQKVEADLKAKFLKELGFESEDELKAKLTPNKPKTPEEIAQDQNIYNISVADYAVKNNVLTSDEWLAANNIRKAPDSALVFDNFKYEYQEANKGRTLEDKPFPVTDDEIKDKFNELYHIDSENSALKAQGEHNLALKAKAIRDPLETKLKDAFSMYDVEMAQKQAVPDFRKFMRSILATAIPKNLEYGTGDEKVVIDLSKLDVAEFENSFILDNKTGIGNREFAEFFKGKGTPEQRAHIEREIQKELLFRFQADIARENFKAGISKGTRVTAPGSKAPFVDPSKKEAQPQKVTVTPQDNKKVADAFA